MTADSVQRNTARRLELGRQVLTPVLAIAAGLAVGSLVVGLQGENVIAAYAALLRGAFGDALAISSTLTLAVPLVLTGLGTALAFRSGLFNLGGEGQLVLGALAAAIVGVYLPLPPMIAPIVALSAGMLAGALWAGLAGVLEARLRVGLLIVTLLQNYIAVLFAAYLVSTPLRDRTGQGAINQTRMVLAQFRLPYLGETRLHSGLLLTLLAVGLIALFWRRTVLGFELRMMGFNPQFARYSGVPTSRRTIFAMLLSGGMIGFGGGIQTLAVHYRYIDTALTAPGYAYTGLVAALIANANPWGTLVAGILLAALQTGASGMELDTGVPYQLSNIIQAVIIIFVAARTGIGLLLARLEPKGR